MKCWKNYHKTGTHEGRHGTVNTCVKKSSKKPTSPTTRGARAASAHHNKQSGPTINEHGNLAPMPRGRSKKPNKPNSGDAGHQFCQDNGISVDQYARMFVHMNGGHAPAHAGRGRGWLQARTDGGMSGRTSRAASTDGGGRRDKVRDAIKRRYDSACSYYRSSAFFGTHSYSREMIVAKAYQLEMADDNTFVLDHLIIHGTADDATTALALKMFPNIHPEDMKFKPQKAKDVWNKKWAEAMEDMNATNYDWSAKFSKHMLRALLLQQCHDEVDEQAKTLLEYIETHGTPDHASIIMATEHYGKDSQIKEPITYKPRKNREHITHALAAKLQQHAGHHAHAHGAGPITPTMPDTMPSGARPRMGSSGVPGIGGVKSTTQASGAYAHDDFGDDLPDDYRV